MVLTPLIVVTRGKEEERARQSYICFKRQQYYLLSLSDFLVVVVRTKKRWKIKEETTIYVLKELQQENLDWGRNGSREK